jgi:uncharacterized phosphosugar-binding protein
MREESMPSLLSGKNVIPVLPASVLSKEICTADITWSSSLETGTGATKRHNNTATCYEISGWVLNNKSEMV